MKPLISIVVCTYNRGDALAGALQSLTHLDTGGEFELELLVVDNNSTDQTRQCVASFAESTTLPVRYIFESQQGVVFARNQGVAKAKGDWIAFFDDDQLAHPDWLLRLWKTAETKGVRCVGGGVHLQLPQGSDRRLHPFCQMLLGATTSRQRPQPYNGSFTPGCGNLMLRKELFEEVGLFDPAFNGRGEDTDLFLRIHEAGNEAWFEPAAIVQHLIPASRLEDAFLLKIAKVMSQDMAAMEHRRWGRWLYPFIWLLRLLRAAIVFAPRTAWGYVSGDRERQIAMRCRWVITSRMLRDGWRIIWSRRLPGQVQAACTTA